ncbi:MAG: 2-oxoacid:acceptor oxidoreductase subunit alpha [bacterium]|nr:2-oxoacid:acceptor oxidoreductase subunit alpha [bacterium]
MNTEFLKGEHFVQGNIACAEGAIVAGCRFFAGYPITPSTEIGEHMAERLPKLGGVFVQFEDEIASIAAILGASWAGVKSMTATSGPGFSLMNENIGLGAMMEVPCVVVNIQRGGPSTGLPTMEGQADVMQARWGSHGDYEIIAVSPNSPQEIFDLTIEAFNLSEQYRVPTIVLSDAAVGHMTEKVKFRTPEEVKITPRRYTTLKPGDYLPHKPDSDLVPPIIKAGDGYRIHTTGLTHDERGYPVMKEEAQGRLVRRLVNKIRKNANKIIRVEEIDTHNADVVVISYGITSRIVWSGIELSKRKGIKVGYLRLITIWPFPEAMVRELSNHITGFVVVEMNLGQIFYEVERCSAVKTLLVPHAGGGFHKPEEISQAIEEVAKKRK